MKESKLGIDWSTFGEMEQEHKNGHITKNYEYKIVTISLGCLENCIQPYIYYNFKNNIKSLKVI